MPCGRGRGGLLLWGLAVCWGAGGVAQRILWDLVGCPWDASLAARTARSPLLSPALPWLLGGPTSSPAHDKTKQTWKDVGVVLVGQQRRQLRFGDLSLQTQRIGGARGAWGL